MATNTTKKPYPSELRERAVRMVREHESEYASRWAALTSIAEKFGFSIAGSDVNTGIHSGGEGSAEAHASLRSRCGDRYMMGSEEYDGPICNAG